ncbi:MAG: hypothetical protein QNJ44_14435 [Rhodobacter sp.]|nr:hypothetical protein [Rhodobacter sp.]
MNAFATLPDHTRARVLARRLFPKGVAIATLDPGDDHRHSWNVQRSGVAAAVEPRRRDIKAGAGLVVTGKALAPSDLPRIPSEWAR